MIIGSYNYSRNTIVYNNSSDNSTGNDLRHYYQYCPAHKEQEIKCKSCKKDLYIDHCLACNHQYNNCGCNTSNSYYCNKCINRIIAITFRPMISKPLGRRVSRRTMSRARFHKRTQVPVPP